MMAGFHEVTKTIELVQQTAPDQTPSPQFLSVDDTKRPRANSDPVGLHIHINTVPEITVTGEECGNTEEDENDSFLIPPSPRRRANTCPEDMFRGRKGRPPTPPPEDLRILRSPAGKRFSFNFTSKEASTVSFAHHRLSKVSEEKAETHQKFSAAQRRRVSDITHTSAKSCSSDVQTNISSTIQTDDVLSRLQSYPHEAEEFTEQSCDQCASTQFKDLTVEEIMINESTNNSKPLTDKVDVLTSSPDSWRSTDNSRENLDSQRLAAY